LKNNSKVANQLPLFAPVDLTFCFAPPGFELVFINFELLVKPVWFLPALFPLFLLFVGNDIKLFLVRNIF